MTAMRLITLFLATAAISAYGQETRPSAETPSPKAQQAADAAVETLIDHVLSLHVAAGPTVSTLVSPSAEAELALRRQLAERCRHSDPRTMPDGSTEIDAWIIASDLARILTSAVAPHVPQWEAGLFRLSPTQEGYLIATGRDSPSAGATVPGWRHLSQQELTLTQAAATIDARTHLQAQLHAFRLDNKQTLAPTIKQLVLQATPSPPLFEPSGVCRVLIQLRRAALEEATQSDLSALPRTFKAAGFAVPPPGVSSRRGLPDVGSAPEWTSRTLTAHATGKGPDDADPTVRELTTAAAHLEASRQLWLQIEALPLPAGDTVGQRVLAQPLLATHIQNTFISLAPPTVADDGTVRVELTVPLTRVWTLIENTAPNR